MADEAVSMDETTRELVSQIANANAKISDALYQVHGALCGVQAEIKHLIAQQEIRDEEHLARAAGHSKRIDDTASKVLAWEAQLKLVLGVIALLGGSGILAAITVLLRGVK